jgi:NAD+ synthase/NAD+ synthase (glutamine-hydrolysing)
VRQVLDRVAEATRQGPPLLVGLPLESTQREGRPLVNAAALLQHGRVVTTCTKSLLPTYDVFDEDRYFEPGRGVAIIDVAGQRCAVSICEDIWNDRDFWQRPRYHRDPIEEGARGGGVGRAQPLGLTLRGGEAAGARASAECAGEQARHADRLYQPGGRQRRPGVRQAQHRRRCARRIMARGAAFREDVVAVDLDEPSGAGVGVDDTPPEADVYDALVLGTRDYARKCGFTRVLVGLSGGIDSALTAAIAAEALGPDRVLGVMMPSPFSSAGSIDDSLALAGACGIETMTLPIAPIMASFDAALGEAFAGRPRDVTEENIQARIRGTLLMALSNKTGALLLTTGNKSELAVGYCIAATCRAAWRLRCPADDNRVSRWLNGRERREIIPAAILDKAPSAELRPNQTKTGLAAALRRFDAIPRTPHRRPPVARRDRGRRVRTGGRATRAAPRAGRRIQAEAGCPWSQGDRSGVRDRLAHAHRARRLGPAELTAGWGPSAIARRSSAPAGSHRCSNAIRCAASRARTPGTTGRTRGSNLRRAATLITNAWRRSAPTGRSRPLPLRRLPHDARA